jgi:hypothetical protein
MSLPDQDGLSPGAVGAESIVLITISTLEWPVRRAAHRPLFAWPRPVAVYRKEPALRMTGMPVVLLETLP